MNVLLTCVGRRDYLVEYFKEVPFEKIKVFAANTTPYTAGMAAADKTFTVPPVTDPTYIDEIYKICKAYCIKLVVPLMDIDAIILSQASKRFKEIGTVIMAPSYEVTKMTTDKWATHLWAMKAGLKSPKTYLDLKEVEAAINKGGLNYPLILKPRWGNGSIGVELAINAIEMKEIYRDIKTKLKKSYLSIFKPEESNPNIIIQEKMVGTEYGMDVFNDLDGNYMTCLIKEKFEMRAGETDVACTVVNKEFTEIGEKIANSLRHVGNIDVDIFVQNKKIFILEINPRFGGHYPFAHAAGANLPAVLVNMVLGKSIDPQWLSLTPGIISAKGIRVVTMQ